MAASVATLPFPVAPTARCRLTAHASAPRRGDMLRKLYADAREAQWGWDGSQTALASLTTLLARKGDHVCVAEIQISHVLRPDKVAGSCCYAPAGRHVKPLGPN